MKTVSTFILLNLVIASWPAKADNKWDITKLDLSKLPRAADKQDVTFVKDIQPLFQASCFRCHGEERQKGDLRLDSLESALKGGKAGKIVAPGESEKSLLVAAVAQVNDDIAMPPKHGPGGPIGNRPAGGPGDGNPPPDGPGGDNPPDSKNGGTERPGGSGGPGGRGGFGPPPKAFTAEQVGLVRAWIDQGAK
jgi:hypothetical protein